MENSDALSKLNDANRPNLARYLIERIGMATVIAIGVVIGYRHVQKQRQAHLRQDLQSIEAAIDVLDNNEQGTISDPEGDVE